MLRRFPNCFLMIATAAAGLVAGSASADFIYTLNTTPGLISHWSLNETSGTTLADSVTSDSVDGNNPGNFVAGGGASLGTAGPAGIGFAPTNKAMSFSGASTQAVTMTPDADFANMTAVSMGMWFRITATTTSQHYYLGGYANTTASDRYGFVMNHYDANNGVRAFARVENPPSILSANTGNAQAGPYRDSNWHYAFMTVGAEGANKVTRLYIDGVLEHSATATGAAAWEIVPRQVLTFGLDLGDPTRRMIGQLDEISIFNRALTAQEIGTIYASASQPLQIPEPSTFCMVLAAATGALIWRRRMA